MVPSSRTFKEIETRENAVNERPWTEYLRERMDELDDTHKSLGYLLRVSTNVVRAGPLGPQSIDVPGCELSSKTRALKVEHF